MLQVLPPPSEDTCKIPACRATLLHSTDGLSLAATPEKYFLSYLQWVRKHNTWNYRKCSRCPDSQSVDLGVWSVCSKYNHKEYWTGLTGTVGILLNDLSAFREQQTPYALHEVHVLHGAHRWFRAKWSMTLSRLKISARKRHNKRLLGQSPDVYFSSLVKVKRSAASLQQIRPGWCVFALRPLCLHTTALTHSHPESWCFYSVK